MSLKVWTNMQLRSDELDWLREKLHPHTLVVAEGATTNLVVGGSDFQCRTADVALGQPAVDDLLSSMSLRWIQLTSAGYTRYDRDDLRDKLQARNVQMTNSSSVYADPCAHQVLAFMLENNRCLHRAQTWQQQSQWAYEDMRPRQRVLTGETAVIVGYGSIGRRLVQLLGPFQMRLRAIRRRLHNPATTEKGTVSDRIMELLTPSNMSNILHAAGGGPSAIPTFATETLADHLSDADHVINLLPSSPSTARMFTKEIFQKFRPGAAFYNVGRGDTVDQDALVAALAAGQVGAAYLDVMTPEPLPSESPLWTAPNVTITPHVAGGVQDETKRLLNHFLENFQRLTRSEALDDRIV